MGIFIRDDNFAIISPLNFNDKEKEMARFMRKITNALRPFKRIRNEIRGLKDEIWQMRNEIVIEARNAIAYDILRDLNLSHKDESLMAFYPKNGGKVGITGDFATMKRYLNAVRPVRVKNLVRVGGANDGGYIMINPRIDLLSGNLSLGNNFADLEQNYGSKPIVSLDFTRGISGESTHESTRDCAKSTQKTFSAPPLLHKALFAR